MPLIPQAVPINGDVFGKIPLVKFDDYDLANEEMLPELAPKYYIECMLYDDFVKVEPIPWARRVSNVGILIC